MDDFDASPGVAINWAFSFVASIGDTMRKNVPELGERWPLQSFSSRAFALRGTHLILFLTPIAKRETAKIESNKVKQIPDSVIPPEIDLTADSIHMVDALLRSHVDAQPVDLMLIARVPQFETDFDINEFASTNWSASDRGLYWACVERAYWTLIAEMARLPAPSQAEAGSGSRLPVASKWYDKHPEFPEPRNLDQPIWRYLSLAKFCNLIQRQAIFFAAPGTFTDKWEGRVGSANYASPEAWESAAMSHASSDGLGISCWHAQDYESAAMWSLYAGVQHGQAEGLAVKSSFRRLLTSLEGPHKVSAGMVEYVDYDKDYIPEDNFMARWMRKRMSFQHEREMRAIVYSPHLRFGAGVEVKCKLETLIDEIRIAPAAPKWFSEVVRSIASTYAVSAPVRQSDMDAEPS